MGHQGHPVLPITAPARRHPGRRLNIQRCGKTLFCVLGPLVWPGQCLPARCLFRGAWYTGTWQTVYKYLLTNRLGRFFLLCPLPTFCSKDTTLFPSSPPLPPGHQPLSQAATFPGVQASTGSMLSSARGIQPLQEFPLPDGARSPPGWARAAPPHTWTHVATQVRRWTAIGPRLSSSCPAPLAS